MSTIEWTDETWTPLRGCRRVSPGCEHCYAERQAARPILSGPGKPYEGLVQIGKQGPGWTGATARPDVDGFMVPFSWKKPRRIFVCSMSDLFYEGHTDDEIAQVFSVMAKAQRHTFQVLTKRAERMASWFSRLNDNGGAETWAAEWTARSQGVNWGGLWPGWPLPNVWIGISVEDQQRAEERLPHLLRVPAAVRFCSYEPALGPVDWTGGRWLENWDDAPVGWGHGRVDWLIVGGESGPGARPFDLAWARSAIEQCRAAGVPCFVKQIGARPFSRGTAGYPATAVPLIDGPGVRAIVQATDGRWLPIRHRKGGDMAEWPADLRVREFPR